MFVAFFLSTLTVDIFFFLIEYFFLGLENHLASEHELNPTLETRRVNQILNSNLGLDQTVNWEEREINTNANKATKNKDTSLDDDMNDKQALLDPDDADPTVRRLKKQFSQFHSFEEEQLEAQRAEEMARSQSNANGDNENKDDANGDDNGNKDNNNDNDVDDEDDDLFDDETGDDQLHDFLCPYCQKHPPVSVPFGDHLIACNAQSMHDDD